MAWTSTLTRLPGYTRYGVTWSDGAAILTTSSTTTMVAGASMSASSGLTSISSARGHCLMDHRPDCISTGKTMTGHTARTTAGLSRLSRMPGTSGITIGSRRSESERCWPTGSAILVLLQQQSTYDVVLSPGGLQRKPYSGRIPATGRTALGSAVIPGPSKTPTLGRMGVGCARYVPRPGQVREDNEAVPMLPAESAGRLP